MKTDSNAWVISPTYSNAVTDPPFGICVHPSQQHKQGNCLQTYAVSLKFFYFVGQHDPNLAVISFIQYREG